MKEIILAVTFNVTPKVRVRIQKEEDKLIVITDKEGKKTTLWHDKAKYPFKLDNDVIVTVETNFNKFSFKINAGYAWNGADIPETLWSFIGSQYSPVFLVSSMIHDYMLEFKSHIFKDVLNETITVKEYRRLTSLIFRECLKKYDTKTVKSNVMAWCVDVFQKTINRKAWDIK